MTPGEKDRKTTDADARGPRSVGGALARFTALRFLLFGAVFLLVRPFIDEPVLALGVAVVGSALLSVPLLAGPRQQLNAATAARAERRRAEQEQRRARLDEG